MRSNLASRLGVAAATAGAAMLAACASSNVASNDKAPGRGAASPPPPAVSHDWRALMLLPFGTLLKDVPYPLGEVVVFHDSAGETGGHEDRDCYTLRATAPPRFFGRQVDQYSLCFSRDRLNRVEASVSLPVESASAQFAAACAEWQRTGTPVAAESDRCEARDGTTEVDARLTASEVSAEPAVSIALIESAPARE
jgi:hypothetical protein